MTLEELVNDFYDFERKTGICDTQIKGVYFWDILRTHCFFPIARSNGIYDISHRYTKADFFKYIGFLAEDLVSFFKLLSVCPSKARTLFLANSRRKLDEENGTWVDPYTDPVIDQIAKNRPITLEARLYGEHKSPTKTERIYYYDFLLYLGKVLWSLACFFFTFTPEEKKQLTRYQEELNKRLNVSIPLLRMTKKAICKHKVFVALFSWLLARTKVKEFVLVCSYGKEHWIEACRRLGIKTIELQHGTITPYHPGYHYPEGTDKHYVPDEFWAFGEYWTRTVRYPSRMKLRPRFGFPYLERSLESLPLEKDANLLLVVSQGIIGASLSRLVVDALPYLPDSLRIVYKLHPGEKLGWAERYSWLKDKTDRIEVIEGDVPSLYELMAKANWQLGVSSTALFEGMRLGCRTIIANLPSVEYMKPVIESGQALQIEEPCQLSAAMARCVTPNGKLFFDHDESMIGELV